MRKFGILAAPSKRHEDRARFCRRCAPRTRRLFYGLTHNKIKHIIREALYSFSERRKIMGQEMGVEKSPLTINISREGSFYLLAEIEGKKQGVRSGHGKTADETLGNLVRINPDIFGLEPGAVEYIPIGPQQKFFAARLVKNPEISSDYKKGHKTHDAALGSLVKKNRALFPIEEIRHHGL
jgi:hypothetical protein